MYRKNSDDWIRYSDFIVLDLICLQLALVLAYALRGMGFDLYASTTYRNLAIFLVLADLTVTFIVGAVRGVFKQGYLRLLISQTEHTLILAATTVAYLFFIHMGQMYSRLVIAYTFCIYLVLNYIVRVLWRRFVRVKRAQVSECKLLVIGTRESLESLITDIRKNSFSRYTIAAATLVDEDADHVLDVPVVANVENVADYVCHEWVDEVLISLPERKNYPAKLINDLTETGVPVHMVISKTVDATARKQFVEEIDDYTVLTTSVNYASYRQLIVKRLMDIVCGLVGCVVTAILTLFLAPAIYIASPGPIFFAQERVGKNGKRFKMYKFRSMYMDAEARKAELIKQNKFADGKMFKLDFDPRVIGNRILPDGTQKTGLGDFIRRTSLDEFPQFFNVLKGDMSIVGTRPPLVSETAQYDLHHRVRLAIKPGITGMWQVSGRSDITDFEEVVRLDKEYIANWSVGLDLKILLKTVLVVLKRDGSM